MTCQTQTAPSSHGDRNIAAASQAASPGSISGWGPRPCTDCQSSPPIPTDAGHSPRLTVDQEVVSLSYRRARLISPVDTRRLNAPFRPIPGSPRIITFATFAARVVCGPVRERQDCAMSGSRIFGVQFASSTPCVRQNGKRQSPKRQSKTWEQE
jgi:hypothetical protein